MSQQEDDLRALAKIMDLLRALSIILVVANIYWFCQQMVSGWQFHTETMKILRNLDDAGKLFHNPWISKWWTLLFLGLSCVGTKGVKNEKVQWIHIWIFLSAGAAFVLPQLVDAVSWLGVPVHSNHCDRLCPDACRRSVYEPAFEEQYDGRPFQ